MEIGGLETYTEDLLDRIIASCGGQSIPRALLSQALLLIRSILIAFLERLQAVEVH